MVYDEKLFKRIEEIAATKKDLMPIRMFGGVGYLLQSNMCFGIYQNYLILRLGTDLARRALSKKHTKSFDITGRPMKGWIMVADKGLKNENNLRQWLDMAINFVSHMPTK